MTTDAEQLEAEIRVMMRDCAVLFGPAQRGSWDAKRDRWVLFERMNAAFDAWNGLGVA